MEVVVGGVVKYPKIKLSPSTTSTKQRKKKILMTFDDGIKIAGDVKFRFKSKVRFLPFFMRSAHLHHAGWLMNVGNNNPYLLSKQV